MPVTLRFGGLILFILPRQSTHFWALCREDEREMKLLRKQHAVNHVDHTIAGFDIRDNDHGITNIDTII